MNNGLGKHALCSFCESPVTADPTYCRCSFLKLFLANRRCLQGDTISLGSVRGIPIQLHYSFFLLLVLEVFISLRYRMYPVYILFVVTLYGPILLLTVIVHELGHALTTKNMGGAVERIVVWPLGGFAVCGPTEGGLGGDLKVAAMGPLMHIPMGLSWWG